MCWLRKCYSSSFLPRPPSEFHQARHRALHGFVLLGRAAIFGHEENNDHRDSPRADCPCGQGGDGRKEATSQLHTCLEGKGIEEIRDFLEWGGWNLGWDHQVRVLGLAAAVLIHAAAFFFDFPAAGLVAAVDLGSDESPS